MDCTNNFRVLLLVFLLIMPNWIAAISTARLMLCLFVILFRQPSSEQAHVLPLHLSQFINYQCLLLLFFSDVF
jgi:hypothetical protein